MHFLAWSSTSVLEGSHPQGSRSSGLRERLFLEVSSLSLLSVTVSLCFICACDCFSSQARTYKGWGTQAGTSVLRHALSLLTVARRFQL